MLLAASATEARALAPVARELQERRVRLAVFHSGALGSGEGAARYLESVGIESFPLTLSIYASAWVAAQRFDGLIMANDNLEMNRFLISRFNAFGKPTLMVQEGVTSWREESAVHNFSTSLTARKVVAVPLAALINCRPASVFRRVLEVVRKERLRKAEVYGAQGATYLCVASKADVAPASLVAPRSEVLWTGIPGLFVRQDSRAAERNSGLLRVLVLSSPVWRAGYGGRSDYELYLNNLVDELESSSRVGEVVLRRHPSEIQSGDTNAQEVTLSDQISRADLCAGLSSTALIEASAMGCPIMVVDARPYFDGPPGDFIKDSGFAFVASGIEGVASTLQDMTPEAVAQRQARFVDVWGRCLDGGAASRIADVVCGWLQ